MVDFQQTQYGFLWGNAVVTRVCSDERRGWVMLRIETDKEDLQVYVTKTGKVRIYGKDWRKWKPLEVQP